MTSLQDSCVCVCLCLHLVVNLIKWLNTLWIRILTNRTVRYPRTYLYVSWHWGKQTCEKEPACFRITAGILKKLLQILRRCVKTHTPNGFSKICNLSVSPDVLDIVTSKESNFLWKSYYIGSEHSWSSRADKADPLLFIVPGSLNSRPGNEGLNLFNMES